MTTTETDGRNTIAALHRCPTPDDTTGIDKMFKLGDQVEKVQLENTMETQKTTRNEDVNATLIIGGSQAK